ncbi:MAG: hypothetical protein R3C44_18550 [Chloroflexota bacterium]
MLHENVGASEIVHRATRLWAFEALQEELSARGIPHNHNTDKDAAREDRIRDMYTGQFEVDGTRAEPEPRSSTLGAAIP